MLSDLLKRDAENGTGKRGTFTCLQRKESLTFSDGVGSLSKKTCHFFPA